MWRAYVDESESNQRLDPGTYLLAAAIIHDEHSVEVRTEIRDLLRAGQRKLHWRDESEQSRAVITKVVTALPALHLVVVRGGRVGEPPERRRRKCFERLLHELIDRDVLQVTLEAREPRSNARELHHFARLRRARVLSTGMKVDHVPGPDEPLLWIPDAVAGAVTAARTGRPGYLELLADLVDVVVID